MLDPITNRTSLASGTVLEGDVACSGDVRIDGEVRGDVSCGHLVVVPYGLIVGKAKTTNAIVYGRVARSLDASGAITLGRGGGVGGTIRAASMVVEQNAYYRSAEPFEFTGTLEIDGLAEAHLHGPTLFVGRHGRVKGHITAMDVTVDGVVEGSICATNVVLKSHSCVLGDIDHGSLTIEEEAFFEGKSRRRGKLE